MASIHDAKELPYDYSPLPPVVEQKRPSCFRRILRGTLWIILSTFIISHFIPPMFSAANNFIRGGNDISLPSSQHIQACDAHEGLGESTTFELPLDAKTLFLESRGGSQSGHVTITSSKDVAKNIVTVHVTSRPSNSVASVHAKVCKLGHDNHHGVGIYSPHFGGISYGMVFDVQMVFPERASLALVKALTTSLSNYRIDLNLGETLSFETVHLGTSNSKINYEASKVLVSKSLTLTSTNGPISGHFSSSSTLYLETSNAPVDVDISLRYLGHPTTAGIKTSNAHVTASYNLTSKNDKGGSFHIHTRTSNNRISLDVVSAPVDSTISVDSQTSNGVNEATVPATFEGSYNLQTSNAYPEIRGSKAEDPTGKGRERNIDQKYSSRGRSYGTISWSDAGKSRGSVHVKSSNAKVVLKA